MLRIARAQSLPPNPDRDASAFVQGVVRRGSHMSKPVLTLSILDCVPVTRLTMAERSTVNRIKFTTPILPTVSRIKPNA